MTGQAAKSAGMNTVAEAGLPGSGRPVVVETPLTELMKELDAQIGGTTRLTVMTIVEFAGTVQFRPAPIVPVRQDPTGTTPTSVMFTSVIVTFSAGTPGFVSVIPKVAVS